MSSKLWFFQQSCMDARVGLERRLSAKELMLSNCGVGENSWEFLGLQGDQTSQSLGNQPWVFFERTDAEAEAPILWPPDVKSWLTGKDPDDGKDWGQEEKRATGEKMVGWHHQLLEPTQTHVHHISDVIQLSHPLLSPSPPTLNLSNNQCLFQWI